MSKIQKAYKTKLKPTRNQIHKLKQCEKVARTAFNWVLADYTVEYREWYATREAIYDYAEELGAVRPDKGLDKEESTREWKRFKIEVENLGFVIPPEPNPLPEIRKKKLNKLKKIEPRYSFLPRKREKGGIEHPLPYVVMQEAIRDLKSAFAAYDRKKKDGTISKIKRDRAKGGATIHWAKRMAKMIEDGKVGDELDPCYPNFKSRYNEDFSIRFLQADVKEITSTTITLKKIGRLKLAETNYIPTRIEDVSSVTIGVKNGAWYISVAMEDTVETNDTLQPITLGVSVGVRYLAATSTGETHDNPKLWKEYADQKSRLQRELARRVRLDENGKKQKKQSNNFKKTKKRLARLEKKIANRRATNQHQISREIVNTLPERLVVKTMDIQEMVSKNPAARYIMDAGMGDLTRKITYKAGWEGISVIEADPKAPVTKMCSECGSLDTTLNDRSLLMTCNECGVSKPVWFNTAENLANVGEKQHEESLRNNQP